MKSTLILFVFLFSSVVYSQGRQPNPSDSSVVLRGEDYAFEISVPKGWVLDTTQAISTGASAILKPQGVPGHYAWIGLSIATKRTEGKRTLPNLLAWFAKIDSQLVPAATIISGPNLLTKDKKPAIVKQVKRGDGLSSIALIDDETIVTVISFHFSQEEFNLGFPVFNQFVQSYRSLSVEKKRAK